MTNLELLRTFIEHAPPYKRTITPVIGIQGEGFTICHRCLNRIQRRCCEIPKPSELIWNDQGITVDCDLKDTHQEMKTEC